MTAINITEKIINVEVTGALSDSRTYSQTEDSASYDASVDVPLLDNSSTSFTIDGNGESGDVYGLYVPDLGVPIEYELTLTSATDNDYGPNGVVEESGAKVYTFDLASTPNTLGPRTHNGSIAVYVDAGNGDDNDTWDASFSLDTFRIDLRNNVSTTITQQ